MDNKMTAGKRNRKKMALSLSLAAITVCSGAVVASAYTVPAKKAHAPSVTELMKTPRIGILSAMGMEQAPILAKMKVQGQTTIDGYTFYMGTLDGKPVVSVLAAEKEYSVELATTLLDEHFHITANLFSGTAGSRNVNVKVGDVVLSGYVMDQASLHYFNDGSQTDDNGIDMVVTHPESTQNDVADKNDPVGPTPSNASQYNNSGFKKTTSAQLTYFSALAGSKALIEAGATATLSPTPLSYITGNSKLTGTEASHVMVGAIASANQWVEPLIYQQDQNALYQTDAEENEGMGFGYVNTQFNVPWLVVRGISDSPWYPDTYKGVLASNSAAQVTAYIIDHMPSTAKLHQNASLSTLSANSNARLHGYLVAQSVTYAQDGSVTKVVYKDQNGQAVTVNNPDESEYTYPTQQ